MTFARAVRNDFVWFINIVVSCCEKDKLRIHISVFFYTAPKELKDATPTSTASVFLIIFIRADTAFSVITQIALAFD